MDAPVERQSNPSASCGCWFLGVKQMTAGRDLRNPRARPGVTFAETETAAGRVQRSAGRLVERELLRARRDTMTGFRLPPSAGG